MEYNRKKELLKNDGFILIKEIFCQRLTRISRTVITLEEAEELFISYLENATDGNLPMILPINLTEAAEYFDKHLDTRENWQFLYKFLRSEYNYKEREKFKMTHI